MTTDPALIANLHAPGSTLTASLRAMIQRWEAKADEYAAVAGSGDYGCGEWARCLRDCAREIGVVLDAPAPALPAAITSASVAMVRTRIPEQGWLVEYQGALVYVPDPGGLWAPPIAPPPTLRPPWRP